MTPQAPTETPRYIVMDPEGFFAPPVLVPRGTIIAWSGAPAPTLEPINQAARDRLEAYYAEEMTYKVKDPDGGEDIVKIHRPREAYRQAQPGQFEAPPQVEILAPPVVDKKGELTLAQLAVRHNTDQRPAPVAPRQLPPEFQEAPVQTDTGETIALVAAPPPPNPADKAAVLAGAAVTSSRGR